ncbi:hypothetical protein MTO96_035561, partial [Rhipicephalus appendiculatus]
MFALVKFLKEFDSNRLYVVDSYSILDFHPRNTDDFDNRRVYSVFWVDEDNNENTRAYEAQVLLLAESREELESKKTSKRVPIPKIQMDTNSDDDKPSTSKKHDHKEASQKRKNAQLRAKSNTYSKLLAKHVSDAQKKARGDSCNQPSRRSPSPKKRRCNSDASSSDGDESLVARSELRREVEEKKMWKKRAERLEEQNDILVQQVHSLQRCLESKIFQAEAIQTRGRSMEAEGIRAAQVREENHGRIENSTFARKAAISPEAAAVSSVAATEVMTGTE